MSSTEKAPLPPPYNFNQVSKPVMPAIDIKRVGILNPLNSPTRQLFKDNLASSMDTQAQNDLTQTTNAEKYLSENANVSNTNTPLGTGAITKGLPLFKGGPQTDYNTSADLMDASQRARIPK